MPRFRFACAWGVVVAAIATLAVLSPSPAQEKAAPAAPARIGLIGIGLDGPDNFQIMDFRDPKAARPHAAGRSIKLGKVHSSESMLPPGASICPSMQWGQQAPLEPCMPPAGKAEVFVAQVATMSPAGPVIDVLTILQALNWMKTERVNLILLDSGYPRSELVTAARDHLRSRGTMILELSAPQAGR
jgi:hypothetical protein